MRIATWNVERLKHYRQLSEIVSACELVRPDVLVLTETDERIKLSYHNCVHSLPLPSPYYKATERRISIFTDYDIMGFQSTYDEMTAICAEIETNRGRLLVYGTIIGIFGNRHSSFMIDLEKQMEDVKRLSAAGNNLCVCGDYNCSFSDNYYYTKDGRSKIEQTFERSNLEILTKQQTWCIDHIAISKQFVGDAIVCKRSKNGI